MGKNVKIRFSDFVNFHEKEDKIGVSYVDKGSSIAVNSNNSNLRNRFVVINSNSATEKTQLVFNDRAVSDGYSFYVKNTQDTDVEISSTFASVNDLTTIKPGELGKVFYDKKNQKVYVELLGGAASSSSGIEGIKSTGTIANKDNEVIIGDDSLGGYVSISYSKGNRFYGENIFSDGYSIESYDASPEIKFDAFYSSSNGGNISHFGRNLDYFTYGKGGLDVNNYFFDFNFTEGFKIKQRINQNSFKEAAIKTGLLTTNQNYQLPNKSITFAGLTDIPKVQAGTNITIDNSDPLKPVINASGSGSASLNLQQVTDQGASTTNPLEIYRENANNGALAIGLYNPLLAQALNLYTDRIITTSSDGLFFNEGGGFERLESRFVRQGSSLSLGQELSDEAGAEFNTRVSGSDPVNSSDFVTLGYLNANAPGGTSNTDLSYTAASDKGTIVSSTGIDAVIPVADKTNAGLMKANFYEEGVPSPSIAINGFATVDDGSSYIRIGNTVHCRLRVINISGGWTGSFSLVRLPFPVEKVSSGTISVFSGSDLTNAQIGDLSCRAEIKNGFNSLNFIYKSSGEDIPNISITNGVIEAFVTYETNVYAK